MALELQIPNEAIANPRVRQGHKATFLLWK
jgi:hypothetical protein